MISLEVLPPRIEEHRPVLQDDLTNLANRPDLVDGGTCTCTAPIMPGDTLVNQLIGTPECPVRQSYTWTVPQQAINGLKYRLGIDNASDLIMELHKTGGGASSHSPSSSGGANGEIYIEPVLPPGDYRVDIVTQGELTDTRSYSMTCTAPEVRPEVTLSASRPEFTRNNDIITLTVEISNSDPITTEVNITITPGAEIDVLSEQLASPEGLTITLRISATEYITIPLRAENIENWKLGESSAITMTVTTYVSQQVQEIQKKLGLETHYLYLPVVLGNFQEYKPDPNKITQIVTFAGNPEGEDLSHAMNCFMRLVFNLGREHGIDPNDIHVFSQSNVDLEMDFDGDGIPDADYIDYTPGELLEQLEVIAEEHPGEKILIYAFAHGGNEHSPGLYLRGSNAFYKLLPSELDQKLTELEGTYGNTFIVIIESCHAISFADELTKSDRVIITSSGKNVAWVTTDGSWGFTQIFEETLRETGNAATAFQTAAVSVLAHSETMPGGLQVAQVEGDGRPPHHTIPAPSSVDLDGLTKAFVFPDQQVPTATIQIQQIVSEIEPILPPPDSKVVPIIFDQIDRPGIMKSTITAMRQDGIAESVILQYTYDFRKAHSLQRSIADKLAGQKKPDRKTMADVRALRTKLLAVQIPLVSITLPYTEIRVNEFGVFQPWSEEERQKIVNKFYPK